MGLQGVRALRDVAAERLSTLPHHDVQARRRALRGFGQVHAHPAPPAPPLWHSCTATASAAGIRGNPRPFVKRAYPRCQPETIAVTELRSAGHAATQLPFCAAAVLQNIQICLWLLPAD